MDVATEALWQTTEDLGKSTGDPENNATPSVRRRQKPEDADGGPKQHDILQQGRLKRGNRLGQRDVVPQDAGEVRDLMSKLAHSIAGRVEALVEGYLDGNTIESVPGGTAVESLRLEDSDDEWGTVADVAVTASMTWAEMQRTNAVLQGGLDSLKKNAMARLHRLREYDPREAHRQAEKELQELIAIDEAGDGAEVLLRGGRQVVSEFHQRRHDALGGLNQFLQSLAHVTQLAKTRYLNSLTAYEHALANTHDALSPLPDLDDEQREKARQWREQMEQQNKPRGGKVRLAPDEDYVQKAELETDLAKAIEYSAAELLEYVALAEDKDDTCQNSDYLQVIVKHQSRIRRLGDLLDAHRTRLTAARAVVRRISEILAGIKQTDIKGPSALDICVDNVFDELEDSDAEGSASDLEPSAEEQVAEAAQPAEPGPRPAQGDFPRRDTVMDLLEAGDARAASLPASPRKSRKSRKTVRLSKTVGAIDDSEIKIHAEVYAVICKLRAEILEERRAKFMRTVKMEGVESVVPTEAALGRLKRMRDGVRADKVRLEAEIEELEEALDAAANAHSVVIPQIFSPEPGEVAESPAPSRKVNVQRAGNVRANQDELVKRSQAKQRELQNLKELKSSLEERFENYRVLGETARREFDLSSILRTPPPKPLTKEVTKQLLSSPEGPRKRKGGVRFEAQRAAVPVEPVAQEESSSGVTESSSDDELEQVVQLTKEDVLEQLESSKFALQEVDDTIAKQLSQLRAKLQDELGLELPDVVNALESDRMVTRVKARTAEIIEEQKTSGADNLSAAADLGALQRRCEDLERRIAIARGDAKKKSRKRASTLKIGKPGSVATMGSVTLSSRGELPATGVQQSSGHTVEAEVPHLAGDSDEVKPAMDQPPTGRPVSQRAAPAKPAKARQSQASGGASRKMPRKPVESDSESELSEEAAAVLKKEAEIFAVERREEEKRQKRLELLLGYLRQKTAHLGSMKGQQQSLEVLEDSLDLGRPPPGVVASSDGGIAVLEKRRRRLQRELGRMREAVSAAKQQSKAKEAIPDSSSAVFRSVRFNPDL